MPFNAGGVHSPDAQLHTVAGSPANHDAVETANPLPRYSLAIWRTGGVAFGGMVLRGRGGLGWG